MLFPRQLFCIKPPSQIPCNVITLYYNKPQYITYILDCDTMSQYIIEYYINSQYITVYYNISQCITLVTVYFYMLQYITYISKCDNMSHISLISQYITVYHHILQNITYISDCEIMSQDITDYYNTSQYITDCHCKYYIISL